MEPAVPTEEQFRFLKSLFPRVKSSVLITSPENRTYNCIAYSVGDTENWYWPDDSGYWPDDLEMANTLECFILLYGKNSYIICESGIQEKGFEKIAIYTKEKEPTHAAIQVSSGAWKSKLGRWHDIEHDLDDLTDGFYGNVALFMKRPITPKRI